VIKTARMLAIIANEGGREDVLASLHWMAADELVFPSVPMT